jgi:ribose transport system permease protein
MKKILIKRESILIIIILIIIIIMSILSKNFRTLANFSGIFVNISISSIIAAGITLILIIGEIDISIGANLAFLGMFLGVLIKNGINIYLSIFSTIILGGFIGFIIGFIVAKLQVDSFVLTIGTSFILGGISLLIGARSKVSLPNTFSISDFPVNFLKISTTKFFKIEIINLYTIIILLIIGILLSKNVFFRNLFYIGSNRKASKILGIKNNLLIISTFILLSIMVAISAILKTSRYNAAGSDIGGMTFTLNIITAAIIGGCSLNGGRGTITGTLLGIVLLSVLNNGLVNIGVKPFYFNIIIGIILIFTLFYEMFISKSFRRI